MSERGCAGLIQHVAVFLRQHMPLDSMNYLIYGCCRSSFMLGIFTPVRDLFLVPDRISPLRIIVSSGFLNATVAAFAFQLFVDLLRLHLICAAGWDLLYPAG